MLIPGTKGTLRARRRPVRVRCQSCGDGVAPPEGRTLVPPTEPSEMVEKECACGATVKMALAPE